MPRRGNSARMEDRDNKQREYRADDDRKRRYQQEEKWEGSGRRDHHNVKEQSWGPGGATQDVDYRQGRDGRDWKYPDQSQKQNQTDRKSVV